MNLDHICELYEHVHNSKAFRELHLIVQLAHGDLLSEALESYPADELSKTTWLVICVQRLAYLSDLPAVIEANKKYRRKRQ